MVLNQKFHCKLCGHNTRMDPVIERIECDCGTYIAADYLMQYPGSRPIGWAPLGPITSPRLLGWVNSPFSLNLSLHELPPTTCPYCTKDLSWMGLNQVHGPKWEGNLDAQWTQCPYCRQVVWHCGMCAARKDKPAPRTYEDMESGE